MLTALAATAAAGFFGCADFLGGYASRKADAFAVAARSQAVGLVFLLAISLPTALSAAIRPDLLWGVLAGFIGGLGVVALYAGLATGRMSVVAPVTAALSGSIPAAVDLARGTDVSPISLVGIALALISIVIVSVSGHDESHEGALRALGLALVAGVCFGISVTAYAQTSSVSGFWPLAAARMVSVPMITLLAVTTRRGLSIARDARPATLAAGALDASANVALVLSLRLGPVAVASVLAALYPVVTVVLARVVLHEHIRGWQRAGVVLALVAVVLAAVR